MKTIDIYYAGVKIHSVVVYQGETVDDAIARAKKMTAYYYSSK